MNITVEQNDGAERTGSVTLSDGLKELVIRITQEDGFFSLGTPTVASSFDLYEQITDKQVKIPYRKSKPGYKADVTASLEGAGAEGIAIESLSGYEMELGDGAIPLALSGTPTKKGPITVKLHVEISSVATPYDLTAESRAKLAGEVTVTMFKLLPRWQSSTGATTRRVPARTSTTARPVRSASASRWKRRATTCATTPRRRPTGSRRQACSSRTTASPSPT